ncbi:hypothetical protein [Bradyrhizobium yuanmingense]|nr:hypothetical protein [Bradyrhizobium yuanmingense]MDF0584165.1 hypothetical protein [Bradyrhizobium yuanmingense]
MTSLLAKTVDAHWAELHTDVQELEIEAADGELAAAEFKADATCDR